MVWPLQLTESAAKMADHPRPETLWPAAARNALPPLPGYDYLVIVDPPQTLDRTKLPGTVEFTEPRFLLIHLPTGLEAGPGTAAGTEHAQ